METHGTIAPASLADAEAAFDRAGPTAQVVVRETAKAMEFDRDEYRDRVTGDVIETVRNALFAESLAVHVGSRAEFDDWCSGHPEYEVVELGNPDVERVAWHAVPFAETVVATTFQNERDAAVSTLRRNAFGRLYRDAILGTEATESEASADDTDTDTDPDDPGGEGSEGGDR
ncbi:hypothetical protein C440_05173 [Haloferax mucosum ATCC BAA-1512]|uniref:Uncharacterized protein n=1 Tax=Haloferax mucosum ATCC BAA-1512 TaxID=662479 RepID=M0IKH7_9EURY|nr:DUF5809 family protein [Haloferax mucosum]ELZ96512.1 hypothetical protein C440_05173 [Haloferax mucosum ATCC BAA-1512]